MATYSRLSPIAQRDAVYQMETPSSQNSSVLHIVDEAADKAVIKRKALDEDILLLEGPSKKQELELVEPEKQKNVYVVGQTWRFPLPKLDPVFSKIALEYERDCPLRHSFLEESLPDDSDERT